MEKYGFIIDNRKCIGCHACTTACKSEHEVPVGVNRTWVKYIEEGQFPKTSRSFSVMRCNHCTNAPCVEMCPVTALYQREDGIVDFDNSRCIGCKACTQACPYDALYIDPITDTAAKCNYCSHRVDVGLEPACVVVCPEHAIIAGDMNNPNSEISKLLAEQKTTVRKPEKETEPNLFYINGNPKSLEPTATNRSNYLWSSQQEGVGVKKNVPLDNAQTKPEDARRVYDAPDKGILWGWEVVGYLNTKAIASGLTLIMAALYFTGYAMSYSLMLNTSIVSLVFMMLTAALLIKDLRQPKRFLYIVFRPQFKSWLARGTYIILGFCTILMLLIFATVIENEAFIKIMLAIAAPGAVITTIYTAFLFGQAKGRAFWKNGLSPYFMLFHAIIFGSMGMSFLLQTQLHVDYKIIEWMHVINIVITLVMFHGTKVMESKMAAEIILKGKYKFHFWGMVILIGNVIPLLMLHFGTADLIFNLASLLLIVGILTAGYLFIKVPQTIALS